MTRMIATLVLVSILSLPAVGQGHEITGITVGAPSCSEHNGEIICQHYFEKEKIAVNKIAEGQCGDLMIKLVQPETQLYAQIGDPLIFKAGYCDQDEAVFLELPNVRRATAFDVGIFTKRDGKNWVRWRLIPIMVYSNKLMDPLKNWAESNPLIVKDESEKLSSFLDDKKINYSVHDVYTDGRDKVTLYISSSERDLADHSDKSTVIIFKEKIVDIPQIRGRSTRRGSQVDVEMKILDELPTNPLVQKTFMRIFKMGLDLNTSKRDQK